MGLTLAAGPASADPTPTNDETQLGQLTVQNILQRNPAARQVGPNSVEITKGVILQLPERTNSTKGAPSPAEIQASCAYYYLCTWEHSYWDGQGYELDYYYCGDYNLGRMRYPDGAWDQPGPKWNDRISMMTNNQTAGATSYFYDWNGVNDWIYIFRTIAYDRRANLADDKAYDGLSMNDRIDRIIPC
jgi:hypothetical protein